MINTSALALRSDLATRFGGELQLNLIARRFAAIFKVDWEEAVRWPDVFGSLLQATQWSWEYGAMPSKHIWLLGFNQSEKVKNERGQEVEIWHKTYSVAASYEWYKASADDKAREMNLRYIMDTAEIRSDDMGKLLTKLGLIQQSKHGGAYRPEDVGYRSRILFLDHARECKELGLPYDPPYHYGFWRKEARQKSSGWDADNVPVGRNRDWVAIKRAEKSALAEHFELRPLAGWHRHDDRVKAKLINEELEQPTPLKPQETAIPAKREINYEKNGDVLYA